MACCCHQAFHKDERARRLQKDCKRIVRGSQEDRKRLATGVQDGRMEVKLLGGRPDTGRQTNGGSQEGCILIGQHVQ